MKVTHKSMGKVKIGSAQAKKNVSAKRKTRELSEHIGKSSPSVSSVKGRAKHKAPSKSLEQAKKNVSMKRKTRSAASSYFG